MEGQSRNAGFYRFRSVTSQKKTPCIAWESNSSMHRPVTEEYSDVEERYLFCMTIAVDTKSGYSQLMSTGRVDHNVVRAPPPCIFYKGKGEYSAISIFVDEHGKESYS